MFYQVSMVDQNIRLNINSIDTQIFTLRISRQSKDTRKTAGQLKKHTRRREIY